MKNYVFDIETVPRSTDELQAIMPAFDPESVKVGNLGPDKAIEKVEKARTEYFQRYYKRAALSALTGQVALIGVLGASNGDPIIFLGPNEAETITAFFEFWNSATNEGAHWIGFNIKNFDLPFLMRRAWLHHIQVPYGFVKGRYLTGFFTDVMELWSACEYGNQFEVSLNDLALYFGFEPKTRNGADFHELLRYNPDEAKEYLKRDLRLTYQVAEAMCAIKYQTVKPEPEPEPELRADPGPTIELGPELQIKFY